jgi:hypothetical protein
MNKINIMNTTKNKREWFVDCNEYEGMINGSQSVVRENNQDNNGENLGLMIIGVSEINNHSRGGLSEKDAILISACPDMLYALQSILKNGLTEKTFIKAKKAIEKAGY